MKNRRTALDRLIATAKKHDHPEPEVTRKAWRSVESAIGAGAVPSVPVALGKVTTSSTAGIKGLVVGVAVVMAGGAALVAGRGWATDDNDRSAVEARSELPSAADPADRRQTGTTAPPIESEPPLPALEPIPSPSVVPTRTRSEAPPRQHAAPTSDADPRTPSTLAEEARLLGQAWRALNTDDIELAVNLVAEHRRRFPGSPLGPERRACEIVAQCKQGHPAALQEAQAFVEDHDGAPASRVREACLPRDPAKKE